MKPIFITGLHKSGTTLLRALLDGHEDVSTIPFESHYFGLAGNWVDNEYQFSRPKAKSPQIADFKKFIADINQTSSKYADNFAAHKIDEKVFAEYLSAGPKGTPSLENYLKAILSATGQDPEKRPVEKSIENFEFADDIFRLHPKAKMIHIVRNPYENLVSLRKFKSIGFGYPLMPRLMRTLYNHYYFLLRNLRNHPERYLMIKYEDLILEQEATIKKVANFLEIKYEATLLNPSILGEAWGGNSMSGEKFKGLKTSLSLKWQDELHPMELKYFQRSLPFVCNYLGYDEFRKRGSWLKPAPKENLIRYVYNRIFNFYWKFYA